VLGSLGPLIRQYDNLRGASLVRKRTMALYLDAANFAAGNASADPTCDWPDEVWTIDRCTARNRLAAGWELRNPLDFDAVMLPGRVVRGNHCPWRYRSSSCGYTGGPVAKADDTATSDSAQDRCGKRLASCQLRFGTAPLPGGFMPGVGQLRQV
jgi:lambda family phage minor tail protein L